MVWGGGVKEDRIKLSLGHGQLEQEIQVPFYLHIFSSAHPTSTSMLYPAGNPIDAEDYNHPITGSNSLSFANPSVNEICHYTSGPLQDFQLGFSITLL